MKKTLIATVAAGIILASASASATLISYTFTADGVTDSVAQQATAVFTFDTANPGWLKITLSDNVSPTGNTASELDGLRFSFTSPLGALTLQSVTAVAVLDCSGDHSVPCPPFAGSPPALYGWGTQLAGDDASLGAGYNGSGFAYHPYAIINPNYSLPGSGNGNLANGPHNPLLVGPVEFIFATGLQSIPEVDSVTFLFGTNPDSQTGTCATIPCVPPRQPDTPMPEPQSLALLGIGLLSAVWSTRRKRTVA